MEPIETPDLLRAVLLAEGTMLHWDEPIPDEFINQVRVLQAFVTYPARTQSVRKYQPCMFQNVVLIVHAHQALTSVLMHEVGHTLGLRHNFRGSAYPPIIYLLLPNSSLSVIQFLCHSSFSHVVIILRG